MADLNGSNSWLPTAPWCGKLILPDATERRDDGSIEIQLLQVPETHLHLKNQTVRLRLDAEWTERVSVAIHFDSVTKRSIKKAMIHPDRLNGWERVSPLESLAGTRPKNDVLVELVDPVEESDYLVIEKEPVQISGTEKALVTFRNKNLDEAWTVQHWNQSGAAFTGPTEVVDVVGRKTLDPRGSEALNSVGWYLYGDLDQAGRRIVHGLEPRSLFQISADLLYDDEESCLGFIKYRNWIKDTSVKGQTSRIHLTPKHSEKLNLKLGDKALLMHLFGAIAGKVKRRAGHFSYGVAEVVADTFTGELRFQVEYKQIYAHNIDGVISGSSQWHCYMGDTSIGKMEIRPVCDYLMFLPELFSQSHGESAYSLFEKRLAEMTARYRTGEGDGLSMVTTAQNCSQDSSQALYAAIRDWKKAKKAGNLNPGIGRISCLLSEHITPFFGLAPWAWKRTAKNKPARRWKLRIIPAIKSYKTIVPRSNSDGLAESAIRAGIPLVLLRSEMIGSTDKDLQPSPPMRPC